MQGLENVGPTPVVKFGVEVPAHGIAVCVYGGEDAAIGKAIYEKKDAGCDTGGNTLVYHASADYGNAEYHYRIVRPGPVNFRVRVRLGGSEPVPPSVREGIIKAVHDDFHGLSPVSGNSRVGLASTVYASRFYMSVMAVEGVKNLHAIEVALGDGALNYADLVAVNGDQEPVLARENISIENGG